MSEKKPRVIGVIPARYASSRFPGKIIAHIAGKPMIQRVYEQSVKSQLLDELIVAVDDERVKMCVTGFGGKAVMTGSHHQSGTDRIAEAVAELPADIIVNIQGDQPLIDPAMIDEAVQPLLEQPEIPMSTLKTRIKNEADLNDPNVVKVVVDEDDVALYFSRSLIPFPRDNQQDIEAYEHVGLYVYRKNFLLQYSKWPPSHLEKIEMLEQMRVLEKGYKIKVIETKCLDFEMSGFSVDTPEELIRVEKFIQASGEV